MNGEIEEIRGTFKPELIPAATGGNIDDYEKALHTLMKFVGSMSSALEQVSGRGRTPSYTRLEREWDMKQVSSWKKLMTWRRPWEN